LKLHQVGDMNQAGEIRPGGRTARTRAAVLAAVIGELTDHGWDQLSVESVAQRAGVHKTTVYRRWHDKNTLVAEALKAAAESRIQMPDTGDIAQDLRELARIVRVLLTSREGAATTRALAGHSADTDGVGQVLPVLWAARLVQVEPVVQRAVARGQLPAGTSANDLMKHLTAPLFHRLLVTAEPLTQASADQAAAAALAAARAGIFVAAGPG
jgi:AcrR family transcriptional regulator